MPLIQNNLDTRQKCFVSVNLLQTTKNLGDLVTAIRIKPYIFDRAYSKKRSFAGFGLSAGEFAHSLSSPEILGDLSHLVDI